MSRDTAHRLLSLPGPPAYERSRPPSLLDPFRDTVLALLDEDPTARATVIRERLQARGYTGGITILKDYLKEVRPQFLAARTYQRTSYLPGEIGQVDWWELPILIPVAEDVLRKVYGSRPLWSAPSAIWRRRSCLLDTPETSPISRSSTTPGRKTSPFAGTDYSVPPGLVDRRVHVRVSLTEVVVFLEGREIARHTRSYVPADVVIDPDHAVDPDSWTGVLA